MPNDHALVLKEHPDVLTVRPLSFIRKLKKKSGVIIIKSDVDSNEIIKKAALTISVTGTSTFESFLIAKQSINLGHSFISSATNNHVKLSELEETIKKLLNSSIDKSSIIEVLSKLISVRYNFIFCQPGEKNEPLLRKKNITEFLLSLLDHINRIDHFKREL